MKIYLVRHGESTSDIRQKYEGDYDDHLTEKGRTEAEEIAHKLADKGIQLIISSARIRAVETAEIVGAILNCRTEVSKEWNEQDIYGAYPELGTDQPEEEYRRLGELIADREAQIPGVETYAEVRKRVADELSIILKGSHKAVAVITHGGPVRSVVRDILKRGELKEMQNGAIIELEGNDSGVNLVSADGAALQS